MVEFLLWGLCGHKIAALFIRKALLRPRVRLHTKCERDAGGIKTDLYLFSPQIQNVGYVSLRLCLLNTPCEFALEDGAQITTAPGFVCCCFYSCFI